MHWSDRLRPANPVKRLVVLTDQILHGKAGVYGGVLSAPIFANRLEAQTHDRLHHRIRLYD